MTSQERHLLGLHGEQDNSHPRRQESGATVQLREEQLAPRKQPIEAGRVSVGTDVVEEEQQLQVPVRREKVIIERQAIARRASDEPISATSDVLSVPVREERVSADKQAKVYEEVNLSTRPVQATHHVADTVRKEVVDVDATGDVLVSGQANERR